MPEQWPAGYDFLFPHFIAALVLSTDGSKADGVVVPVDSRVEAIIVYPTVVIAGVGGVGVNLQVLANEETADGPSFNLPEGSAANKGHLLRPTDFVDYALLAGTLLEVESDGLQIAVTPAYASYILRPI